MKKNEIIIDSILSGIRECLLVALVENPNHFPKTLALINYFEEFNRNDIDDKTFDIILNECLNYLTKKETRI